MNEAFSIRNLENHEVFHFDQPIWGLSYNSETRLFSCNDFRADQWQDNVCRRPLALTHSLFPELDAAYVCATFDDAQAFYNWLRTEAHPAYLRMCHAPG